ncbi:MAG TPA: GAF domain-containing SpoIIE family protein phosphatase, partial [Myxococcaceae bacterium]|nr:GAF domain-containing SpoIIE family protein phosphatase [Myxococcaceae bacterium]
LRHTEEEREIRVKRVSVNDPHTTAFASEWAILTCLEQDDLGTPMEQAIARREAQGRHILDWPEYNTHFYIYVAYARLRQYRRADEKNKPQSLAVLQRALRDVKMIAVEPLKRSHYVLLRASVARELGDVRLARRLLREAERLAIQVDCRFVLYEVKMERARDAQARGDDATMRREAEGALDMANKQGWRNRARVARNEFKLPDPRAQDISTNLSTNTSSGAKGNSSDRYLNALLRAAEASSSSLEPIAQARAVLDEIVRLLGAERAFLFLKKEEGEKKAEGGKKGDEKDEGDKKAEGEEMVLRLGRDAREQDLIGGTPYSGTVVKRVVQTREPLVVTGTENDIESAESVVAHELRSIIAAPLLVRDKLLGVVYLDNRLVKGLFTEDDQDILRAIANHIAIAVETASVARLEIERRDLEHDMKLTAAVQSLFLPKEDSCVSGAVSLHGFYRPAGKCSGDWWWYEVPSPGSMLVLIGDTTGHGAAPAMVTAAVAAGFRISRKLAKDWSLQDTLGELSQQLLEISAGQYRMTLSAVHLDARTRKLRYWSAGAPPLLVLRSSGKVDSLACAGTPLGSDSFEVGWREVDLMPGDRIFSFTDGLSELELPSGRQFGMRRLSNLFIQTRGLTLSEATEKIVSELDLARGKGTSGEVPQGDDLTFALLEVQP